MLFQILRFVWVSHYSVIGCRDHR